MGSLITVLIVTLVIIPLVVGGVLKGATGAGRLLRKGKDQGVVTPISGPKLGRFGVWAIAWASGWWRSCWSAWSAPTLRSRPVRWEWSCA